MSLHHPGNPAGRRESRQQIKNSAKRTIVWMVDSALAMSAGKLYFRCRLNWGILKTSLILLLFS